MREEIILILSRSVKAVVKMTIPFILPRPIILSSSRDECSKSTFSMKKGSLKTSRISSKDNPCFFFVHLVLDTIPFIISVYNCHFYPFSIPLLYFFFIFLASFFIFSSMVVGSRIMPAADDGTGRNPQCTNPCPDCQFSIKCLYMHTLLYIIANFHHKYYNNVYFY